MRQRKPVEFMGWLVGQAIVIGMVAVMVGSVLVHVAFGVDAANLFDALRWRRDRGRRTPYRRHLS